MDRLHQCVMTLSYLKTKQSLKTAVAREFQGDAEKTGKQKTEVFISSSYDFSLEKPLQSFEPQFPHLQN